MSDSTGGRQDRLDRFARRELTPAESRRLAQESQDSAELFDDLTSTALAAAALDSPAVRHQLQRRTPWTVWIAAAAAVIALVSILYMRPASTRREQVLTPALAHSAKPGQPLLLAELLQPDSGPADFRGVEPDSRPPRSSGVIVSIQGGIAQIDLGSLDGIAQGDQLGVYSEAASAQPAGRITLTTVFRDRARGRIDGTARARSQVRVAPPAHLNALLDQVSALHRSGDSEAAQKLAGQAARLADTASAAPPSRRAAAWNALAAFHLLHARPDSAEPPLRQVLAIAPRTDPAWARATNNLGVLSEMRGDRPAAEGYYSSGLHALSALPNPPAPERRALEANLARVRDSR